jgi:MFS family permease
MVIINKNHRKFIIVTTSFFHGLYFFGFFLNDNYYYIASLKFFASFCKVFITVYIPVWIDQFGIKKYKTLLLTIVFMVTSYGRIVGAWIGTVIFENEWKKAFTCCGIIFLILSIGLFIIPQKYYSTKYMLVEQQKKYTGNIVEKLVPTKNDEEIKKEIENIKDIEYLDDEKKKSESKEMIKEETEKDTDVNSNDKKEKLIYDYKTEEENKMFKNLSTFSKFKIVILNQCFIFSSLSRACLFFLFKIIHVFLKKYTFEALNYNNEITFFYYYSLTTILAPSLGSLIGGAICNKFLGGYESKKSIWIILFFGTIAVFFITLARISIDFNYLIIYIFGYFFSVSAFLPTISGYIINSLHKELKGFGSSFDSLITNILGKLPSPIIYGIINDRHKKEEPKYAWNKSLMVYYLGTIFIYLACFFKWKLNDKNKKKVKGKSNDVVEQTMKDYTLNRSSLLRADKPVPKYDKNATDSSPVELDYVDDSSSTNINNKNNIKKKLLLQLNKNEEKNEKEKAVNSE